MISEHNILLSVVIPCYNENNNIEECIKSLIGQHFIYGRYEIIIVDGMSTDGTREVLNKYSSRYSNLRIVDNIKRYTPHALNLGIANSRGDFISILGAHSTYDKNYLANSYSLFLKHPEADCTGGPIISDGKTVFGKAAALAMSHPLGVGNAKHRFPYYEGYAEGACFPTFRKEIFEKVGKYDERLIKNQDDELNFRLTKSGGKVYISPEASATYFVRDTFLSLFKQYYYYGFWRVAVTRKHKQPIAIRQVIPAIFVILFLISLISLVLFPNGSKSIGLAIPIVYSGALLITAITFIGKKDLKVLGLFPIAAMILHFSYGIGFIAGCFFGQDENIMLAYLLDIRKTIFLALLTTVITLVFITNLYLLLGLIALILTSIKFGVRNTIIAFTISTYLLVTSDLNESLRNVINAANILLLAGMFMYYEGISTKQFLNIPAELRIFLAVLFTSLILSTLVSEYITISISTTIRQFFFLIICFFYFSFLKNDKIYNLIVYTLITISIILGSAIFYQLCTEGISSIYLESINAVRFSGLYNNPNAAGLFFTVSIPLLFSFFFNRDKVYTGTQKSVLVILFTFLVLCLVITNSRASLASVLLSLGFTLFSFRKDLLYKIIGISLTVLVLILALPIVQEYLLFYLRAERIFSNTRTYFWSVAFDIIKNYPIFGVGPGVFEEYIYKYLPVSLGSFFEEQMSKAGSGTAHNFFLFRMADLGILGFATSVWLFVLFFKFAGKSIEYYKVRNPQYYLYSVTIKSIGLGLLIRAFLESTGVMTHGWITRDLPFWLVFILLISIYQKIPTEFKRNINEK